MCCIPCSTVRTLISIKRLNELFQFLNIFQYLLPAICDIIMPTILDPPWRPFAIFRHSLVQCLSMCKRYFLVQEPMNDHNWTVHFFNSGDIWENIQTSQCPTRRQHPHPTHECTVKNEASDKIFLGSQITARTATHTLPIQNDISFIIISDYMFNCVIVNCFNICICIPFQWHCADNDICMCMYMCIHCM